MKINQIYKNANPLFLSNLLPMGMNSSTDYINFKTDIINIAFKKLINQTNLDLNYFMKGKIQNNQYYDASVIFKDDKVILYVITKNLDNKVIHMNRYAFDFDSVINDYIAENKNEIKKQDLLKGSDILLFIEAEKLNANKGEEDITSYLEQLVKDNSEPINSLNLSLPGEETSSKSPLKLEFDEIMHHLYIESYKDIDDVKKSLYGEINFLNFSLQEFFEHLKTTDLTIDEPEESLMRMTYNTRNEGKEQSDFYGYKYVYLREKVKNGFDIDNYKNEDMLLQSILHFAIDISNFTETKIDISKNISDQIDSLKLNKSLTDPNIKNIFSKEEKKAYILDIIKTLYPNADEMKINSLFQKNFVEGGFYINTVKESVKYKNDNIDINKTKENKQINSLKDLLSTEYSKYQKVEEGLFKLFVDMTNEYKFKENKITTIFNYLSDSIDAKFNNIKNTIGGKNLELTLSEKIKLSKIMKDPKKLYNFLISNFDDRMYKGSDEKSKSVIKLKLFLFHTQAIKLFEIKKNLADEISNRININMPELFKSLDSTTKAEFGGSFFKSLSLKEFAKEVFNYKEDISYSPEKTTAFSKVKWIINGVINTINSTPIISFKIKSSFEKNIAQLTTLLNSQEESVIKYLEDIIENPEKRTLFVSEDIWKTLNAKIDTKVVVKTLVVFSKCFAKNLMAELSNQSKDNPYLTASIAGSFSGKFETFPTLVATLATYSTLTLKTVLIKTIQDTIAETKGAPLLDILSPVIDQIKESTGKELKNEIENLITNADIKTNENHSLMIDAITQILETDNNNNTVSDEKKTQEEISE